MKLLNTLLFIMNHPLNKKNKLGSLLCFIKWQLKSRLYKSKHIYKWVDKTNFIIKRGEHALTGNLYCGLLEYEDMSFVLHSLKETDNFYDIGANVGSYTLLASGVKRCKSFCFEPIQSTFERLIDNVNLNNFSGSLEILLDLAKSQKVDLEKISITKLADQFHQYLIEKENLNLEIASEYLLMATWLTYLKSKLLLPETDEDEFKAFEVAEKLKLQLKKLELIRLLSSQMLDRKRLGRDVFMRGSKSGVKSIYDKKVSLTLFELLKAYSGIVMTKDFHTMNIPKLPVFTTEDAIKRIKEFFGTLNDWKNLSELVPSGFNKSPNLKKTGKAGIFAGSLELVKEGNISLKQKELFDDIYIKEN